MRMHRSDFPEMVKKFSLSSGRWGGSYLDIQMNLNYFMQSLFLGSGRKGREEKKPNKKKKKPNGRVFNHVKF